MINHKFSLKNAFQEILCRIDNWINEESGWIIELIESQCIKISTYRPLSVSSYVELPVELKSPKKVLMNVQSNDQKCFSWCHVTHINPVEIHPGKITEKDKKHANDLDYDEIKLSVQKEDFSQIDTTFALTCFVMKIGWFYQFTFQIKNLEKR